MISTFLRFWLIDRVRDNFLSHIDEEDLPNLRHVCHDWNQRLAPRLFKELKITFKPSTLTRPARIAALERIGPLVQTLTFCLPQTEETFLPPLVNPQTGQEESFVYSPQVHTPSSPVDTRKHPKYGSWEVAGLLVKQYPPLFHASTNVPAFIRALSALPNLNHLKISCPNESKFCLGRRSTVDYALISLRMAMEHAPLHRLEELSFLPIHPHGLFYMKPFIGYGTSPKSLRRWAQIRKMTIIMESWDTDRATRSDQLKTLHSYLRGFARTLTQFHFRWQGTKGPSPISLDSEPCVCSSPSPSPMPGQIRPHPSSKKNEKSGLTALNFTALQGMQLENAVMDATQISAFICQHRRTLEEFKFEHIKLRSGDWDEALSPLERISHNGDHWNSKKKNAKRVDAMSMDVPLMLSPENMGELVIENMNTEGAAQQHDHGQQNDGSSGRGLSRLLSKASRAGRATSKAKEQILEGSEHVKNMLKRNAVLPWNS
ncbi:MAG: hypothetical protein M1831_001733 [Alyxoria varia]|nr:MAG: hypothetical protein M1831_001733 [Alyxoria varia]